uniref:Uncharacterized protein n=1 Tax=Anguilla anguilla TaxID=7936 RepID=A0A0E9TA23_ANGAN
MHFQGVLAIKPFNKDLPLINNKYFLDIASFLT